MSRGFVREDDQEESPVIPPRAALPAGVTNYVTPNGYRGLLDERDELETEQKNLADNDERERRRASMEIDGKLKLLNQRIATARVIDLTEQPQDEVRFGAQITFKGNRGRQKFQIVGVDEADVKRQKIAFVAPIARIFNGKKVGESAEFKRGAKVQKFEILDIAYPS